MQHDEEQIRFDDLAEVLKSANVRRSADLGKWLKEFLHERSEEGVAKTVRSAGWPPNQAKA
ncbi:hypothetical protein [Bradyrhizobium sp.]|jgi:hypothetical protein|uniref:hypothetical protein n=1 Tax=Bradyrhizobium sp. TaxID=376 RepID=UPI003C7762C1